MNGQYLPDARSSLRKIRDLLLLLSRREKWSFAVSDWNWWDCKLMFTYYDIRIQEMKDWGTKSILLIWVYNCRKTHGWQFEVQFITDKVNYRPIGWSTKSFLIFSQKYRREAPPVGGQVAPVPAASLRPGGWPQARVRGVWRDARPARGHLPRREPRPGAGRGAQAPGAGNGEQAADKIRQILATTQQSSRVQVWVWISAKIKYIC